MRGICFSPEKREKLEHFEKLKSGVKIKKYGENNKYGALNIVIERNTEIHPCSSAIPFGIKDLKNDKTIKSLEHVSANQTVTIRGKVIKMYDTKKIPGKDLTKQECMIADANAMIKVVLWESFINSCEVDKSYDFINFTYKMDRYGTYLGSTQEGPSVNLVEDMEGPLVEPLVDDRDLSNKEAVVRVIGICSVEKYFSCACCKKNLKPLKEI